jgi:hypothetical protein
VTPITVQARDRRHHVRIFTDQTEDQDMNHPIRSAIAAVAIFAGLGLGAQSPAAAQAVTVPTACSSGEQLVRNGIPYMRQCQRYRGNGECVRFTVTKCGGGGFGRR